jgi:chromosome segregation ATPase
MSSKTAESNSDAEQDQPTEPDDTDPTDGTPDANPLQIALPDGSASVSDAIVTHREMLREPQDHGLATEQDITHLSEAIESLSANIAETSQQHDESRSEIEELQDVVAQQRQQIDELQSMVASLAGILGTETEWETFEEE